MMKQTAKALAITATMFGAAWSGTGLHVTALGAGGVVLMAGEAMAGCCRIPGVGIVIKSGKSVVAKGITDDNDVAVFKLEPGEYSVTVGENRPQDFTIRKGQSGIKIVVTGTKEEYVGHVTLLR